MLRLCAKCTAAVQPELGKRLQRGPETCKPGFIAACLQVEASQKQQEKPTEPQLCTLHITEAWGPSQRLSLCRAAWQPAVDSTTVLPAGLSLSTL
jgi:hypothetical protein